MKLEQIKDYILYTYNETIDQINNNDLLELCIKTKTVTSSRILKV